MNEEELSWPAMMMSVCACVNEKAQDEHMVTLLTWAKAANTISMRIAGFQVTINTLIMWTSTKVKKSSFKCKWNIAVVSSFLLVFFILFSFFFFSFRCRLTLSSSSSQQRCRLLLFFFSSSIAHMQLHRRHSMCDDTALVLSSVRFFFRFRTWNLLTMELTIEYMQIKEKLKVTKRDGQMSEHNKNKIIIKTKKNYWVMARTVTLWTCAFSFHVSSVRLNFMLYLFCVYFSVFLLFFLLLHIYSVSVRRELCSMSRWTQCACLRAFCQLWTTNVMWNIYLHFAFCLFKMYKGKNEK